MEQAINSFSGGLQSDAHPMVQGNESLSDALNATFVTMNGNEIILQNDMGNRKVDEAFLPAGYVPVGMKEYGGVIYVAAYNPITNMSQIGSFPSPKRKYFNEPKLETTINFNKFITDINGKLLNHIVNDTVLYTLTSNNLMHVGDKFYLYSEKIKEYVNEIINGIIKISIGVLNSLNEYIDITDSLKNYEIKLEKKYLESENGNHIDIFLLAENINTIKTPYNEGKRIEYILYNKENIENEEEIKRLTYIKFIYDGNSLIPSAALYCIKLSNLNTFELKQKIYYSDRIIPIKGCILFKNFVSSTENNLYKKINGSISLVGNGENGDLKIVDGKSYYGVAYFYEYDANFPENYKYFPTIKRYTSSNDVVKFPINSDYNNKLDFMTQSDSELEIKRQSSDMNTYSYKLVSPLYAKIEIKYPKAALYSVIKDSNSNLKIIVLYKTETHSPEHKYKINIYDNKYIIDYYPKSISIIENNSSEYVVKAIYEYQINTEDIKDKEIELTITPVLDSLELFGSSKILLNHLKYHVNLDLDSVETYMSFNGWKYQINDAKHPVKITIDYSKTDFKVKNLIFYFKNTINKNITKFSYEVNLENLSGQKELTIDKNELNLEKSLYLVDINYTLEGNNSEQELQKDLYFLNTGLFDENYSSTSNEVFDPGTYEYSKHREVFISDYRDIRNVLIEPEISVEPVLSERKTTFKRNDVVSTKGWIELITSKEYDCIITPTVTVSDKYPNINLSSSVEIEINDNAVKEVDLKQKDSDNNLGNIRYELGKLGTNYFSLSARRTDIIKGTLKTKTYTYELITSLYKALLDSNSFNIDLNNEFMSLGFWHDGGGWRLVLGSVNTVISEKSQASNTYELKDINNDKHNLILYSANRDTISNAIMGFSSNANERMFILNIEDTDKILTYKGWNASKTYPSIGKNYNMSNIGVPRHSTFYSIWMRYSENSYFPIIIYPDAWENKGKEKFITNYGHFNEDILYYCQNEINRIGYFYRGNANDSKKVEKSIQILDKSSLELTDPKHLGEVEYNIYVNINADISNDFFLINQKKESSFTIPGYSVKQTEINNAINYIQNLDSNTETTTNDVYYMDDNGNVDKSNVYDKRYLYRKTSSGLLQKIEQNQKSYIKVNDNFYICDLTNSNSRYRKNGKSYLKMGDEIYYFDLELTDLSWVYDPVWYINKNNNTVYTTTRTNISSDYNPRRLLYDNLPDLS